MANSCNTEFSLNGDYEVTPVVFGLLDHNQDFHTVKITKAFLGDDDNLLYAQNPDSSYFNQVDATITEYKDGSATGRSWVLFDTIMTDKDTSGLFYAPEQKVYGFYESALDSTCTYDLNVDLEGGAHNVTASTELIDKFRLTGNILNPAFRIQFAPNTVNEDSDYDTWIVNIAEGLHAARYNFKYTIRWTEYYTDMTSASFSAERNNGDKLQTDKPSNPLSNTGSFLGLDFYQFVRDVVPDDPNVEYRRFNGLDLKISVAHEELEQFMSVSEPVSGIAQVQPEFTNVTNGRGLFSSRAILIKQNLQLNPASMKDLCIGGYTVAKLFKSDYPEHIGELFYQP